MYRPKRRAAIGTRFEASPKSRIQTGLLDNAAVGSIGLHMRRLILMPESVELIHDGSLILRNEQKLLCSSALIS
jgi:hypothetical protein